MNLRFDKTCARVRHLRFGRNFATRRDAAKAQGDPANS
jgi:hypothetical protein